MANVFIFHGIYGHPGENWFPWLKEQLEKEGHTVIIPAFPHPDKPTLDEWMKYMERYEADIDENTVFIGHSLGTSVALRYLERNTKNIDGAFFVAPVWCPLGNDFDPALSTSTEALYDWKKIMEHCDHFSLIYSDNDPYIRAELSEELAKHLSVEPMLIKGAGHFNEKAGYKTFPFLFEIIREDH